MGRRSRGREMARGKCAVSLHLGRLGGSGAREPGLGLGGNGARRGSWL
jgi:hypothetical protein